MKKKKITKLADGADFDPDLLKMYLMGATNPVFSNKIEMPDEVIDLHLEQHQVGQGKIAPNEALYHQIEEFERALDKAIASGKFEFRVVHGLGKGKLKAEICKILDGHPNVKSYSNDYHSKYGYGSTLIQFC